jgi:hypothetical protein
MDCVESNHMTRGLETFRTQWLKVFRSSCGCTTEFNTGRLFKNSCVVHVSSVESHMKPFDDGTCFIRPSGSCCHFPFSPDLFHCQIRAVIRFKGSVQLKLFKMLMKTVGQQFWLFCGTGKYQCGRNDQNFDVKVAGFSTMTMLVFSQRCPSRSFSWRPRLQCWHSYPTACSVLIGSTALLQLDLSALILQPPYSLISPHSTAVLQPDLSALIPQLCYSLICLLWFYSHPTAWSLFSGSTATLQPDLSALVLQPPYSLICLHWFYSHPTAWSLCIGSTAVLQPDLSALVLQPPYSLISLHWFYSHPTVWSLSCG